MVIIIVIILSIMVIITVIKLILVIPSQLYDYVCRTTWYIVRLAQCDLYYSAALYTGVLSQDS